MLNKMGLKLTQPSQFVSYARFSDECHQLRRIQYFLRYFKLQL